MKTYSKILLVHTAFVGDVILITPLIRALMHIYPNAVIDVLVIPETSGILANNPHIREIHRFNKRKNKFNSFLKTLIMLKKEKYDLTMLPHSSMTTALLTFFAGIKRRIGFDRNSARYLLTDKVTFRQGVHRIEKNLDLLKPLTTENFSLQTELYPSAEAEIKINKIIKDNSLSTKNLIALSPGSVWHTKRWNAENYRVLVQRLTERGYDAILIGAPNERELCEYVKGKSSAVNLAGKTTILESASVLDKCRLLICNDSGAMHIANAMQIDVLVFFGPTVQSMGYFPFRETDKVMEVELDCRPCSNHGTNECPLGHHNCMKFITVDSVIDYIEKKLER